ncbi:amidohydrolase family protein [Arachnia propionica]|uniref:amidohydrolase family protein n=1 Tax=Arachnia propionica TaxID=1750 RepID=UPI00163A8138|nr:amidohydrolase family protein [Arachnia propionica]
MASQSLHIHGTFIPETEPRDLWIHGGVLTDGPVPGAETVARDAFIVPGLVDAHCHIGLGEQGQVSREVTLAQARADLAAGTMLIRDAGSPSDTRWVQQDETLPRLIRSGRHIARTRRYIRHLAVEVEPEQLVDQVRHEARDGDGWVKLVGDWIDRSTGDLEPSFPADVAARAIAVAHEEGARVTAHCFGEQAVAELVAAGIDCIEHGTGMSDEVIDEMARRGTALVPTFINLNRFPQYAEPGRDKYPRFASHLMDLHHRRHETIGKAIEAGLQVWSGTDAGTVVPHGEILSEVAELAGLGGAEFAVKASSWGARQWLGASGLEVGASADLIVMAEDPRRDVAALRHPVARILRGRVL